MPAWQANIPEAAAEERTGVAMAFGGETAGLTEAEPAVGPGGGASAADMRRLPG